MTRRLRVLPCGDAALLVEVDGLPEVLALADAVRRAGWPAVLDVIPAARTVLLATVPGADLAALHRTLSELPIDRCEDERPASRAESEGAAPAVVEIPVVYDGPDLDEVGRLTGLGPADVVEAHTGRPWRVAFGGFAPGFAYLAGGDERLVVPRRDEARAAVPAGAVGLAGEFSGVYPRESPGGWQLIGRTGAVLWAVDRDPPALLRPGGWVRFVPVPHLDAAQTNPGAEMYDIAPPMAITSLDRDTGPHRNHTMSPARDIDHRRGPTIARGVRRELEVLATGALALVQDLGRPGFGASGVGRSGAADRGALRLANRLVANPEGAAGIEVVFGGLSARAGALLTVALAGAPAPATVNGTPVGHHAVVLLRPGTVLTLGTPPSGLRTYLAVRGGIRLPPVLGSQATDVLSQLGPPALTPGTVLPIGPEPAEFPLIDVAPVAVPPDGTVTLRAMLGPRAEWFAMPERLARTRWTASSRSDRIGMRLDGEPLRRAHVVGELPSEGVMRGAVQVPPSGQPVLFLADHPVTGGYPVVAVVLDADVDRAAQIRPGQRVRFTVR